MNTNNKHYQTLYTFIEQKNEVGFINTLQQLRQSISQTELKAVLRESLSILHLVSAMASSPETLRCVLGIILQMGSDFFKERLNQTDDSASRHIPLHYLAVNGSSSTLQVFLESMKKINDSDFIKHQLNKKSFDGFNALLVCTSNDNLTPQLVKHLFDAMVSAGGINFLKLHLKERLETDEHNRPTFLLRLCISCPIAVVKQTFEMIEAMCGSPFLKLLLMDRTAPEQDFFPFSGATNNGSMMLLMYVAAHVTKLSPSYLQFLIDTLSSVCGVDDLRKQLLAKGNNNLTPLMITLRTAETSFDPQFVNVFISALRQSGGNALLKEYLSVRSMFDQWNHLMFVCRHCPSSVESINLFFKALEDAGGKQLVNKELKHVGTDKVSPLLILSRYCSSADALKAYFDQVKKCGGFELLKELIVLRGEVSSTTLQTVCANNYCHDQDVPLTFLDTIEEVGGETLLLQELQQQSGPTQSLPISNFLTMFKITKAALEVFISTIVKVGGLSLLQKQLSSTIIFATPTQRTILALASICTNVNSIDRECFLYLCSALDITDRFHHQYSRVTDDEKTKLQQHGISASFTAELTFKQELLKAVGNLSFKKQQYRAAVEWYSKAVDEDRDARTAGAVFSNRALCFQELHQYMEALKDAEDCIRVRDEWWKGHSRKGTALRSLGRLDDARVAFIRASRLDPHNEKLRQTCDQLDRETSERQKSCDVERHCRMKVESDRAVEFTDFARESLEMIKEIEKGEVMTNEITRRRNELARRLPRVEKSSLNLDLNDESLELGSGSTCHVHACSYYGTDTAAKIFLRHVTSNKNLQHEMSAAIHVKHPNILNLLGIIVSDIDKDKIVGLLMQRMSGTLLERVKLIESFKQSHPPSRLQLLTWCAQTAAAIACAHSLKCIHCDIKPENVMLDQHQNAKLSDFGSAHVMSTVATEMTGVRGTALYTAPELTKGASNNKPSEKTDVFSFGMLMWVVFHSSRDHGMGPGVNDINNALGRGERPTFFDAGLPADIVSLIRSCWHEDPSERPNMAEAVAVLHRVIASHTQNNVNDDQDKTSDALFKRSQLEGKLRDLRDEKKNHIDQILDRKIKKKWLAGMNFSMDIPTARLDELQRAIDELEDENLELTQIIGQQAAAVDDSNEKDDDDDNEDDENQSAHLKNADTRPARGHQAQSEVSVATSSTATAKRTTVSAFTGAPSATSSEMRQVQNDDDLF